MLDISLVTLGEIVMMLVAEPVGVALMRQEWIPLPGVLGCVVVTV